MRFLIALIVFPFAAYANDFAVLEGDIVLSRAEVVTMTRREILQFYEGGQSHYSAGGAYSYTYAGGGTAYGAYTINESGMICIAFRNGRSRCDRFVRSHGRLVMLTEDGQRYPIRP